MDKKIEEFTADVSAAWQRGNLRNCHPATRRPLCEVVAEELADMRYVKIPENAVVLTMEEYNALISEHRALTYKYDNICDRYRLYKDACETIKQHAIMARKETAEKLAEKIKEKFEALSSCGQVDELPISAINGLINDACKEALEV